jgi:hypothetical protein
MKQSWKYIVCTVIVMALTAFASAQSLGETARQERAKQKPQAAKVITNEDIPSVDTSRDATTSTAADKKDDDNKDADKKKELSADDKLKEAAAWKSKVAAQDAKTKDLDREINLMQREHKLREAVFYADAGSRVRDERTWFGQERKYQADLSTKQKNLATERNKLDELKDAARKAGVGGID